MNTPLLKSLLALFLLFATVHSSLQADELDDSIHATQDPLFVSLGSDCLAAGMVRHFGKRQAAFPFDWLRTLDHFQFLQILNTNFQDFTNKDYLVRHPITNAGLVHRIYNVEFAHDWNEDYWGNATQAEEGLERVRTTYERRIERFRQLENYKGKVIFIRVTRNDQEQEMFYGYFPNTNEKEFASNLYDALKRLFPHLDFKLIVVDKTNTQNSREVFGNILFYHLTDLTEHRQWEEILLSG